MTACETGFDLFDQFPYSKMTSDSDVLISDLMAFESFELGHINNQGTGKGLQPALCILDDTSAKQSFDVRGSNVMTYSPEIKNNIVDSIEIKIEPGEQRYSEQYERLLTLSKNTQSSIPGPFPSNIVHTEHNSKHEGPLENVTEHMPEFIENEKSDMMRNVDLKCIDENKPRTGDQSNKPAHLKENTGVFNQTKCAELRFPCMYCAKRFRWPSRLEQHMRLHRGIRLKCVDCERSYTTRTKLRDHCIKTGHEFTL